MPSHIGDVMNDGILRVRNRGEIVAEIPNGPLVDEAPVYNRPVARPAYLDAATSSTDRCCRQRAPPRMRCCAILASPTVASKRWVYRQYDHMVRTNSLVLAGMGAGVVRIKGTKRALAMSTDGNGRYCYLNPRRGAMLALAEAARNVACAGALPIGGTNCLNFGNPERPEIMWQFVEAVEGLADACRALDIPITGGNVSLYNETDGQAIYPTPIIGVVGLIENARSVVSRTFKQPGDEIVLLGEGYGELGGSEYLQDDSWPGEGAAARARPRQGALAHRVADASGRGGAAAVGPRLLGRRRRGHAGRVRIRHRRDRIGASTCRWR